MLRADSRGTRGTCLAAPDSSTPSTSSRFDAGSVLTSSTRRPASARSMAVAQAVDVLPAPPLPVKNRIGVGSSITVSPSLLASSSGPSLRPSATGARRRHRRLRRSSHALVAVGSGRQVAVGEHENGLSRRVLDTLSGCDSAGHVLTRHAQLSRCCIVELETRLTVGCDSGANAHKFGDRVGEETRGGCFAAGPYSKFGARWVHPAAFDLAVYLHERQRRLARNLEGVLHGCVFGEGARLLREAEALHRDPLALQPIEVSREAHESRIDRRSADPRSTAHGRVEHLHDRHNDLLVFMA